MFREATDFNQPLGAWDVGRVTDLESMFYMAEGFNQSLDAWDVGKVINMWGLFRKAIAFNQPLGTWDTSQVTSIKQVFHSTTSGLAARRVQHGNVDGQAWGRYARCQSFRRDILLQDGTTATVTVRDSTACRPYRVASASSPLLTRASETPLPAAAYSRKSVTQTPAAKHQRALQLAVAEEVRFRARWHASRPQMRPAPPGEAAARIAAVRERVLARAALR